MGVMRWALVNRLKALYGDMVSVTYGYITKNTRIENGLEKAHYVDAICIAGHPKAETSDKVWHMVKRRSHNRQIHKLTIQKCGLRKLNQCPRVIYGFKLFDKVSYNGIQCYVHGRRSSGSFDIRKFDGTKISGGMSYKRLMLTGHSACIDIW